MPSGNGARAGDTTMPDMDEFGEFDDDGEATRADIPAWYHLPLTDNENQSPVQPAPAAPAPVAPPQAARPMHSTPMPPPAQQPMVERAEAAEEANAAFDDDDLPTMMNVRWDGGGSRPVSDDFGRPNPHAAPARPSALPGFTDQTEEPTRADTSWRAAGPNIPRLDPRAGAQPADQPTTPFQGDSGWPQAQTNQNFDPNAIAFDPAGEHFSSTGQQPIDLGTQQRLNMADRALSTLEVGTTGPGQPQTAQPSGQSSNLRYWLVFGGIITAGLIASALIVVLR